MLALFSVNPGHVQFQIVKRARMQCNECVVCDCW